MMDENALALTMMGGLRVFVSWDRVVCWLASCFLRGRRASMVAEQEGPPITTKISTVFEAAVAV